MNKILVVTKNKGKLKEILEIYKDLGLELKTLEDYPEVTIEETGKTFFENAFIKADATANRFNVISLGEDSGLCVDYLDGAPGVYSKRFAGDRACDDTNNRLLLEKLKGLPFEKRKAHFISTIVLMKPGGEYIWAEGRVDGYIAMEPKGNRGFGYDPIFYLPELHKTFAELTDEEKNRISHRRRALENLKFRLKDFLNI